MTESTMPAVHISSPILTDVNGFEVSSGIVSSFTVIILLTLFALVARRKFSLVPSKIQIALEGVYNFFYSNMLSAFGSDKAAKKFLPMIFVMFLFLLFANQFTILPFIADLAIDGNKIFQAPATDINLPIAWSLMIVVMSHILALSISPLKHIGGFIRLESVFKIRKISDIFNAILELFLGILDIIGEFAKVISLSARLFGNIFAGELMVVIITYLVSFIVPIPFIFLNIFGGLIHACIFPLLSLQYLAQTVNSVKD